MAKMHGKQSQYLLRIYKLNKIAYYVVVFFAIVFFVYLFEVGILSKISGWILTIIIASPLFFYLYKEFYSYWLESKQYINGSRAEGSIWYELIKLPDEYNIFQDLKNNGLGNGNIDFVVTGPTGVFTVEVKSHKGFISLNEGKLIKNGKDLEKDFLKQAKQQALVICNSLKESVPLIPNDFFVKPIVVFASSRAKMNFGKIPVESVFVIKKQWLNQIILNSNTRIPEESLKLINSNIQLYLKP